MAPDEVQMDPMGSNLSTFSVSHSESNRTSVQSEAISTSSATYNESVTEGLPSTGNGSNSECIPCLSQGATPSQRQPIIDQT